MSFEAELWQYITNHPTLAPLLGDRVYPIDRDDTDLPAATYLRVDRPVVYSHGGTSGLTTPRYQFDIYAADHASLTDVVSAWRSVFEAKTFVLPSYRVASLPAGDSEGNDETTPDEYVRATLDYLFHVMEG